MTHFYFRSFSIFITAMTSLLFLGQANAGEITRPNNQTGFEWKSTECLLPTPPPISSNQSSGDRLTKYALDIELYISCIQQEAQRDFGKAQEELQRAIERDLGEKTLVMNEMMMRAAKTMR